MCFDAISSFICSTTHAAYSLLLFAEFKNISIVAVAVASTKSPCPDRTPTQRMMKIICSLEQENVMINYMKVSLITQPNPTHLIVNQLNTSSFIN